MSAGPAAVATRQVVLEAADLGRLVGALRDAGYDVIGPVARDGAIVYEPIRDASELPAGWTDEQGPGRYRLERSGDSVFGYTVGVTSWKRWLYPPRVALWRARAEGRTLAFEPADAPPPRMALFGVRPCELAAIAIQDRVLLGGPWSDPVYRARREQALIVAVHCTRAGATCFCGSLGTGPRAASGYDLALTELPGEAPHAFLLEIGSERGAAIVEPLAARAAKPAELAASVQATDRAAARMGRSLALEGLAEDLERNPDHPHWAKVAERCLACGNCTQVCPTCFCTSVVDVAALGGPGGERVRRWDSCFSPDFSYIHGGSVRPSVRARYRQWLTHKFSSWHHQFGGPGCTGCGRCIAWCPAGIDVTEETAALRSGARREDSTHADA